MDGVSADTRLRVNSALTCAETAPARARAKRAYFIMASASVMSVWVAVWPVSGSAGGWRKCLDGWRRKKKGTEKRRSKRFPRCPYPNTNNRCDAQACHIARRHQIFSFP